MNAVRQGVIPKDARVVCIVSESGFKGLTLLSKGFDQPLTIKPSEIVRTFSS